MRIHFIWGKMTCWKNLLLVQAAQPARRQPPRKKATKLPVAPAAAPVKKTRRGGRGRGRKPAPLPAPAEPDVPPPPLSAPSLVVPATPSLVVPATPVPASLSGPPTDIFALRVENELLKCRLDDQGARLQNLESKGELHEPAKALVVSLFLLSFVVSLFASRNILSLFL